MTRPNKPPKIQSWIVPCFAWGNVLDAFAIIVSADDGDIVKFISRGSFGVTTSSNKLLAKGFAALSGGDTLRGQLYEAAQDSTKLMPADWKLGRNADVSAYLVGAFLLPDETNLGIVVSRSKPTCPEDWLSTECKAKADDLLRAYEDALQDYKNSVDALKQKLDRDAKEDEEFYGPDEMQANKNDFLRSLYLKHTIQMPFLTSEQILPLLPRGVMFSSSGGEYETLAKRGIAAVAASGLTPSRDGLYFGIVPTHRRRGARGIVTWNPYVGNASYPEVRAAVRTRVSSGFYRPRQIALGRAEIGPTIEDFSPTLAFGDEWKDVSQALDEIRIDQPDASGRAEKLREKQKVHGFEAIAWYQSYHVWTEGTWGIYFDALKLDDLAYGIYEDLRRSSLTASHSIAAFLAFGLTYAHELFHARVEAASSWLELNVLQGRHLRYSQGVYERLRETPEWLEEALANWSAWEWFKSDAVQSLIAQRVAVGPQLHSIIETLLDFSPPGYRDWRQGFATATWRRFVTQLTIGKSKLPPPGIGLPLETVIMGPLPYDFRASDIPLRFVGTGVIANQLLRRPASFNVPTRRELEKALKHFEHSLDASAGRGGHQKWTGPDQRAFSLPTRDPVSQGVFKTFLHHVGIDKATYVQSIRPNL